MSAFKPLSLFLFAVTLLSGCAESRTMLLEPAPPDLLAPERPVAVRTSHQVIDQHGYIVGGSGEGAAVGFGGGVIGAIGAGAQTGEPLGLALGILIAPVTGVGGGIYGAAAAHPEEEVNLAVSNMQKVYEDDVLLASIGSRITRELQSLGYEAAPLCPSGSKADGRGGGQEDCMPGSTRNRFYLDVKYSFTTTGVYDPDLWFTIETQALAGRPQGQASEFRWIYRSNKLQLLEVAKNGASGLRKVLAEAEEKIARRILDDLLLFPRAVAVKGVFRGGKAYADRFEPAPIKDGTISRYPTIAELTGAASVRFLEETPDTALFEKAESESVQSSDDAEAAPTSAQTDGKPAVKPESQVNSAEVERLCTHYEGEYRELCDRYASNSFVWGIRIGSGTRYHHYSCRQKWSCPTSKIIEYHNLD